MSTYQIRSLSLGGVLDQAVAITKNHFGPLLAIVVITLTPFTLIANAIITIIAPMPVMPPKPTPQDMQVFMDGFVKTMSLLAMVALPSMLAAAICNAAIVRAIADVYLGQSFAPLPAIRSSFRRILPLIGTWIVFFLAYMVGLMLCFIPGILVLLWYSLATQIVVIEGISGIAAMNRSKALMKGNVAEFFALLLVMGLASMAVNMVAGIIPQLQLRMAVAAVIQSVFTVFSSAAMVVFYFSARCKNEQFDLQLLADNVGTEVVLEADDDQRSAK